MRELIEYLAKALVDKPEEVKISETQGEIVTVLEIRVAPDEVGKVIGREGRIINAIRVVAKAAAAKQDKKITVEVISQEGKEGGES